MVPDLTLETIYFGVPTDFKMEFDLCGSCSVRFLSTASTDKHSFLVALQKSVSRSRVIVTVGGFFGKVFLPSVLGSATGIPSEKIDKELFGLKEPGEIVLPKNAIPLVTVSGDLGGLVLESKDQAIIMLCEDYHKRHEVVETLVCPYLSLLAKHKMKLARDPAENTISPVQPICSVETTPTAEPAAAVTIEIIKAASSETLPPVTVDLPTDSTDITAEMAEQTEDTTEAEAVTAQDELKAELQDELQDGDAQDVTSAELEADKNFKSDEPPEMVVQLNADNKAGNPVTEEQVSLKDSNEPKAMVEQTKSTVLEQPKVAPFIPPITEKTEPSAVSYTVLEDASVEQSCDQFAPILADFIADEWEPGYKNKKTKHRIIRAVIAILLVISVLLGAYFGYQTFYQPMQGSSVYQNVISLYGQKAKKALPSGVLSKFGRLYLMNDDLIGWLNLPGTNINYPIVSLAKASAAYYNNHIFDRSLNEFGTIYTSNNIANDSFNRNILVYGKDFSNDKMLSELDKYKSLDFYRAAPVLTFDTIYTENNWKIFSVFSFAGDSPFDCYKTKFFDDSDFLSYISQLKNASSIQTSVDMKQSDEILTLFSKGAKGTTVVVARKVRNGESSLVDVTGSTVNENNTFSTAESSNTSSYKTSSLVDLGGVPNPDTGSRYEQKDPTLNEKQIASNIAGIKPKTSSTKTSSKATSSTQISSQSSTKPSSSSVPSSPVDLSKLPTLTVINASVSTSPKVTGSAVDIIANILEAEMGSGFQMEALKAQAVATYSWLLCNGAATGSAPKVPMKAANARAKEAANAVAGVCAVYGGNIAQTLYYAISAGRSANSEDIWSTSFSYLKSVDSSVDKNASGFQTIRTYSASDVQKWVLDKTGINLGSISDKTKWFKTQYDANGLYVKTVTIGSTSFKGTYLRNDLFTDDRVGVSNGLRSSAYTITYNQTDDKFTFTVKGYGHGVGMSQIGANAYASSGWTYDQILNHYYTGITLGTYLKD